MTGPEEVVNLDAKHLAAIHANLTIPARSARVSRPRRDGRPQVSTPEALKETFGRAACGVGRRAHNAVEWIRKHDEVSSNPGMGDAGLYYYYHTFAKALDALGIDEIEDAQGVKHDWRRDLTEELAWRQEKNGSWVNTNTRWMEGDPNLATAFALLALSSCRPK